MVTFGLYFCLFDCLFSWVHYIVMKYIQENAHTLDRDVNPYHFDLIELTTAKLLTLAESIRQSDRIIRVQPWDVIERVKVSVKSGYIDRNSLSASTIQKISV